MFRKKLSQMETAQDQEIKELERNADMLLKREVKAFPYIQKLDIISKLLVNAKLKQYLALTQGNSENFKQEGASIKYYEKCIDYEIRRNAKESLEKAEKLKEVITDKRGKIALGDLISITIHETAKKNYKIEIEVDPAECEKIEALKNDGFKLQQRSENRFIDIYSKYI